MNLLSNLSIPYSLLIFIKRLFSYLFCFLSLSLKNANFMTVVTQKISWNHTYYYVTWFSMHTHTQAHTLFHGREIDKSIKKSFFFKHNSFWYSFAAFHMFWYVVFLFSFFSNYLLINLFLLRHLLLRSALSNFYVLVFHNIFLIDSNFNPLCLEGILSIILNLLWLVSWPN